MNDEALEMMYMARAVLWGERDGGGDSRELSVALTSLDTAILWRQEDLRRKAEVIDEASQ